MFAERYKSYSNMNINKDSQRVVRVEFQTAREPTNIPAQMKKLIAVIWLMKLLIVTFIFSSPV